MQGWGNFFVATAGAAAALTGLIFVGVSISLNKILSFSHLPGRALEALISLLAILIASLFGLVPNQPATVVGIEILALGIIVYMVVMYLDINMLRTAEPEYKKNYRLNIIYTQFALLPYLVAAIAVLCCGLSGLYWIIPAFMFSFLKSLTDAWILLIEIHR